MFANDLAAGQDFERRALEILGPGWYRNPDDLGVDLLHPDLGSCECKFDRQAHKTGNVFLETAYRGEDSGIFKYPCQWWMQGSELGACLLAMDDLLHLANFHGRKSRGGDRDDSQGLLVRWSDLLGIATKSVAFETEARILPVPAGQSTSFPSYPMADVFEAQDIFGAGAVPARESKTLEPGTYLGTLYGITDLGTRTSKNQRNGEEYDEHMLKLSFEVPSEMADFGKGKMEPYTVHDQFVRFQLNPASKSQKVSLYKYAQALVGLTPEGIKSFALGSLIGQSCQLTLEQNGDYVNIVAVAPRMKGLENPKQINAPVKFSIAADGFDSPKFEALNRGARETLTKSHEFAEFEESNPAKASEIREKAKKPQQ